MSPAVQLRGPAGVVRAKAASQGLAQRGELLAQPAACPFLLPHRQQGDASVASMNGVWCGAGRGGAVGGPW